MKERIPVAKGGKQSLSRRINWTWRGRERGVGARAPARTRTNTSSTHSRSPIWPRAHIRSQTYLTLPRDRRKQNRGVPHKER